MPKEQLKTKKKPTEEEQEEIENVKGAASNPGKKTKVNRGKW
jgi:hypothetical protein